MNIGLLIKKLRNEKNLTQKQFAEMAGISQSYYNEIEKGKANCPIDTLATICKTHGISLAKFFSYEELYEDSDIGIMKDDCIDTELTDIGVDYIALAKEMKSKKIKPEAIKKILDAFSEMEN